jgi:hypothetical protein
MASRNALGGIPAIPSTDLTNEMNRIVVAPLVRGSTLRVSGE